MTQTIFEPAIMDEYEEEESSRIIKIIQRHTLGRKLNQKDISELTEMLDMDPDDLVDLANYLNQCHVDKPEILKQFTFDEAENIKQKVARKIGGGKLSSMELKELVDEVKLQPEDVLDIAFYLSTLEPEEPDLLAKMDFQSANRILKLISRTAGGQKLTAQEAKDLRESTLLDINDIIDIANWANQQVREDPEILEKLEAQKKDEILLLVARKAGGQKLTKKEVEELSQTTGLSNEDIMDLGNYVIGLIVPEPQFLKRMDPVRAKNLLIGMRRLNGGQKLSKEEVRNLTNEKGLDENDIMDIDRYLNSWLPDEPEWCGDLEPNEKQTIFSEIREAQKDGLRVTPETVEELAEKIENITSDNILDLCAYIKLLDKPPFIVPRRRVRPLADRPQRVGMDEDEQTEEEIEAEVIIENLAKEHQDILMEILARKVGQQITLKDIMHLSGVIGLSQEMIHIIIDWLRDDDDDDEGEDSEVRQEQIEDNKIMLSKQYAIYVERLEYIESLTKEPENAIRNLLQGVEITKSQYFRLEKLREDLEEYGYINEETIEEIENYDVVVDDTLFIRIFNHPPEFLSKDLTVEEIQNCIVEAIITLQDRIQHLSNITECTPVLEKEKFRWLKKVWALEDVLKSYGISEEECAFDINIDINESDSIDEDDYQLETNILEHDLSQAQEKANECYSKFCYLMSTNAKLKDFEEFCKVTNKEVMNELLILTEGEKPNLDEIDLAEWVELKKNDLKIPSNICVDIFESIMKGDAVTSFSETPALMYPFNDPQIIHSENEKEKKARLAKLKNDARKAAKRLQYQTEILLDQVKENASDPIAQLQVRANLQYACEEIQNEKFVYDLFKEVDARGRIKLLIERQFTFYNNEKGLYIEFKNIEPFRYCCKKLEKYFKPVLDRITANIKNSKVQINVYGDEEYRSMIKEKVLKFFTKFVSDLHPDDERWSIEKGPAPYEYLTELPPESAFVMILVFFVTVCEPLEIRMTFKLWVSAIPSLIKGLVSQGEQRIETLVAAGEATVNIFGNNYFKTITEDEIMSVIPFYQRIDAQNLERLAVEKLEIAGGPLATFNRLYEKYIDAEKKRSEAERATTELQERMLKVVRSIREWKNKMMTKLNETDIFTVEINRFADCVEIIGVSENEDICKPIDLINPRNGGIPTVEMMIDFAHGVISKNFQRDLWSKNGLIFSTLVTNIGGGI